MTSLLILTTTVFSLLRSSAWKEENLSTGAAKDYNKCKRDITLLIVLISSHYFEQNQRLLSKETEVLRWWGSQTLKFGAKQLHKGSNFHHELITKSTFRTLAEPERIEVLWVVCLHRRLRSAAIGWKSGDLNICINE